MSVVPAIYVGLPHGSMGAFGKAVQAEHSPALISANSLWDKKHSRFRTFPPLPEHIATGLDSAGFVAMMQGGYRWTPEQYVEWAFRQGRRFPFLWWSAMDFACEAAIAPDRKAVGQRMQATVDTYRVMLEDWLYWTVDEGASSMEVPEPMPVLQGRRPDDYLWSAAKLAEVRIAAWNRKSSSGATYSEELDYQPLGLPDRVGLGSVCRREIEGEEGLVPVVAALDAALPKRVKLHLFGVKSGALRALTPFVGRIGSIDSMAWDYAARTEGQKEWLATGVQPPKTSAVRVRHLLKWLAAQREAAADMLAIRFAVATGDARLGRWIASNKHRIVAAARRTV